MNAILTDAGLATLEFNDTPTESLAVLEPVELEDLSRSLCYVMRRANLELSRRFMAQVGQRHAIRPGITGILMVTGANPGIGQVDIAQQLGLDKANAADLIRSLEAAHWITRKRSSEDRRRQGVYLTQMGLQRLQAIYRDTQEFEKTMFAQLTQEERNVLLTLLRRVAFP
jgi:DNA-binding MarR family transcriptional regulator